MTNLVKIYVIASAVVVGASWSFAAYKTVELNNLCREIDEAVTNHEQLLTRAGL